MITLILKIIIAAMVAREVYRDNWQMATFGICLITMIAVHT